MLSELALSLRPRHGFDPKPRPTIATSSSSKVRSSKPRKAKSMVRNKPRSSKPTLLSSKLSSQLSSQLSTQLRGSTSGYLSSQLTNKVGCKRSAAKKLSSAKTKIVSLELSSELSLTSELSLQFNSSELCVSSRINTQQRSAGWRSSSFSNPPQTEQRPKLRRQGLRSSSLPDAELLGLGMASSDSNGTALWITEVSSCALTGSPKSNPESRRSKGSRMQSSKASRSAVMGHNSGSNAPGSGVSVDYDVSLPSPGLEAQQLRSHFESSQSSECTVKRRRDERPGPTLAKRSRAEHHSSSGVSAESQCQEPSLVPSESRPEPRETTEHSVSSFRNLLEELLSERCPHEILAKIWPGHLTLMISRSSKSMKLLMSSVRLPVELRLTRHSAKNLKTAMSRLEEVSKICDVKKLHLQGMTGTEKAAEGLQQILASCVNMTSFRLADSFWVQPESLFESLQASAPRLVELELSGRAPLVSGLAATDGSLCTLLEKSTSLRKLKFSMEWMPYGPSMRRICGSLKACTALTTLELPDLLIGPTSMEVLEQSIAAMSELRTLNLSGNWLGLQGVMALGRIISTRPGSVAYLNLDNCRLYNEEVDVLTTAWYESHALRSISLKNNKIGASGATGLLRALFVRLRHVLDSLGDATRPPSPELLERDRALLVHAAELQVNLQGNCIGIVEPQKTMIQTAGKHSLRGRKVMP